MSQLGEKKQNSSSGFTPPKNLFGSISKKDNGSLILTVEQDFSLKKNDKLVIVTPQDDIDGLVSRGFITEDEGETRKERVPKWKQYLVKLLPARK
jgi:hypothetical protein